MIAVAARQFVPIEHHYYGKPEYLPGLSEGAIETVIGYTTGLQAVQNNEGGKVIKL
jgi:hypothetical protein